MSASALPVVGTPTAPPEDEAGFLADLDAAVAAHDAHAAQGVAPGQPAPSAATAPAERSRPARGRKRRGGRKLTRDELARELRAARSEADELRARVEPPAPPGSDPAPATEPIAPPPPPDPERARRHAAHLTRAVTFAGNLLASARGDHMRLEPHEVEALQQSAEDSLPALEAKMPQLGTALDWLPGVLLIVVLAAIVDRRLQAELAIRRGDMARAFTPAAASQLPAPTP